jgi:biopolymer transport protein ExbB
MNIVERVKLALLGMGAGPVLWALLGASVIRLATIFERAWFFRRTRDDLSALRQTLGHLLRSGAADEARQRLEASPAPEAAVVLAGLAEAERGATCAEKAMDAETAVQRKRLERRLAFLGTLGNNAPFVGLFGTVVGIIEAFDHLGQAGRGNGANAAGAAASADVMSAIAEALVATAVGLAVAIPAVIAFNFFQRQIKSRVGSIEALSAVLLGHLAASPTRLDERGS